jgi:hypothetical protein
MNPVAFYVVIAIVLAAVFTCLAVGRRVGTITIDIARSLMSSLDIEAFRNLVDHEEDAFLQSCLPADQFKTIKRERAWAALAYARSLSHIALEFSRFGHALRHSPDPSLAELGREVATGAVHLRMLALQASARLFISAAFPKLPQRSLRSLFEQYGHSASLLARYRMLERARKQPSQPSLA